MKTMLEILNETIAAYTSENRAIDRNGFCSFLTDDGRMCAIGRCLINPSEPWEGSVSFKSEYCGYSLSFWSALQVLHDRDGFWDDKGLSPAGVNHIAMHPILSAVKDGKLS